MSSEVRGARCGVRGSLRAIKTCNLNIEVEEIIKYIIKFLVGDHVPEDIAELIGYTSQEEDYTQYKLVIKPSEFFEDRIYGTLDSLPKLPLKLWEEIPILFGEPTEEMVEDTLVLHADIVAGTYFLISRYEETVRRDVRDAHRRFPGKESLPYRAGFIDRPIIEEWGAMLRRKLREMGVEANDPPCKINKVYLTHDVDQLAHYRNIKQCVNIGNIFGHLFSCNSRCIHVFLKFIWAFLAIFILCGKVARRVILFVIFFECFSFLSKLI